MEELPSGTSIHSQDIVIVSEVITPDRCERTSIECLDVCSCANTEARYPRDGCISQFWRASRRHKVARGCHESMKSLDAACPKITAPSISTSLSSILPTGRQPRMITNVRRGHRRMDLGQNIMSQQIVALSGIWASLLNFFS